MTDRATVFGGDAASYDRYRPGYPSAVVSFVAERCAGLAVDVGCGTGKAARLLREHGVDVLGIEVDERMAAVARSHGIEVVTSRFEQWAPTPCDVMYSAQAWHWVDPVRGADIAARAVQPGGSWIAFWNDESDPALVDACADVYRRCAPELLDESAGRYLDDPSFQTQIGDPLASTGAFAPLTRHEVTWTDELRVADVVQRLGTHSAHRLLAPDLQQAVGRELMSALGGETARWSLRYRTVVFSTRRK
ncbi:MAG: class I SAM-dependent methyltransferase [Actinomycetota bacterium]